MGCAGLSKLAKHAEDPQASSASKSKKARRAEDAVSLLGRITAHLGSTFSKQAEAVASAAALLEACPGQSPPELLLALGIACLGEWACSCFEAGGHEGGCTFTGTADARPPFQCSRHTQQQGAVTQLLPAERQGVLCRPSQGSSCQVSAGPGCC